LGERVLKWEKPLFVLRLLRDLGLVILIALILFKVATDNSDSDGTNVTGTSAVAPRPVEAMTNSIGMKLRNIPAGAFSMGSRSQVMVTVDFWVGQHEVTQAEYRRVVESNPSHFPGDLLPVERVSWDDAAEFCRRLSALENRTYRLPTEAEWEYACRAGSRAAFNFGDDDSQLGEFAWYDASAGNKTHTVGSRKPNPWGLHDLHGNVWEWCADWYQQDHYATGLADNSKDPATGEFRVLRGGCWYNRPVMCRSARRDFNRPDYRDDGVGFRVVLEDR
jgi:formylglycine-generating enzyme required for sulfatase activity